MNFVDKFMVKWEKLLKDADPHVSKVKDTFDNVSGKVDYVFKYILKFKKLFLCVPVAVMALILAIRNLFSLPALVGFIPEANGDFEFQMIREIAVLAPLLVTALCLLLVYGSKKTLTPWLVSVFSLLLPIWILIVNTFPS